MLSAYELRKRVQPVVDALQNVTGQLEEYDRSVYRCHIIGTLVDKVAQSFVCGDGLTGLFVDLGDRAARSERGRIDEYASPAPTAQVQVVGWATHVR